MTAQNVADYYGKSLSVPSGKGNKAQGIIHMLLVHHVDLCPLAESHAVVQFE